jgi:hypothetical protein
MARIGSMLLVAALVAAVPLAASAEDDEGWAFMFAPYIWGLSMDGDATVGGTTTEIDTSFRDILEQFNFGLMGILGAEKGPWSIGVDGMGALLGDEQELDPVPIGFGPATVQQGPITLSIPRVGTSVGPTEIDFDSTMVIVRVAGGYRLYSRQLGGPDSHRRFDLHAYAGGRFWYLKMEIDVEIPPVRIPGFSVGATARLPIGGGRLIDLGSATVPGATVGGVDRSFEDSQWWIDPLIGLRFHADLSDRWQLFGHGDVGGFGIGSASDFTWEAALAAGYRVSRSWTLALGYRAIGIDHDGSAVQLDAVMHGPQIGAVYRWGAGLPDS